MTDIANAESLSTLIRDKRQRENLSLREAGETSGVAFSTLARIEAGATPSLKVYLQIRHWLNNETATLPTPPMTLRDWFAGQFVAALADPLSLAAPDYPEWAGRAYRFADAVLAERAKASPEGTSHG